MDAVRKQEILNEYQYISKQLVVLQQAHAKRASFSSAENDDRLEKTHTKRVEAFKRLLED